jgi:transcriptional regulator
MYTPPMFKSDRAAVEQVGASFKLNQHKSDADYVAIAPAMLRQPDDAAQTISKQMVALRPQLDYNSPAPGSAKERNAP